MSNRHYLDASVIVPFFVGEENTDIADRFISGFAPAQIVVSDFAIGEVSSVLSRHVRMKSLDRAFAHQVLANVDSWKYHWANEVSIVPTDTRRATEIVRRFDLGMRMPDALHIAICQRVGNILVTFDKRLLKAATEFGIEAMTPA